MSKQGGSHTLWKGCSERPDYWLHGIRDKGIRTLIRAQIRNKGSRKRSVKLETGTQTTKDRLSFRRRTNS